MDLIALPTLACIAGIILALLIVSLYAWHYSKNIACRRYYKSNISLKGKTVIITGGNSGIGRVTALDLARRGARVILACRNLHTAEEAAKEMKTRTGNSEVVVRQLDLASLQSVREFARKILESETRLDILINNAAMAVTQDKTLTEDNFPILFGVNHFGHFLLTNLLLDLLKKSAPSRVITVSSIVHAHQPYPLDLTRVSPRSPGVLYPNLDSYHHSKLANVLFAKQLAKCLDSTGVTSVSLHPGVIFTPIWKNVFSGVWPLYHVFSPFLRLVLLDEEAGAQTVLHCALDESVTRLSGRYFTNCEVIDPSKMAQDDDLARRLWEISCQATKLQ